MNLPNLTPLLKYWKFAAVAILLSSCNVTKDIAKTKTEEKTNTDTKTVTTATITEKVDTTIVLKADTLKAAETEQELESNPIEVENSGLKLEVKIDPKTKRITARAIKKPETVHAFVDKTTVEVVKEDKKEKTDTVTKEKDKHIERTGGFNFNYLWWLLLLLLIPVWKFRKYWL